MNAKRYIAQLLLAVYLLATGGTAFVSLSCRCVAMSSRSEAHVCCDGCSHLPENSVGAEWAAPCCEGHHSIEIDLYTGFQPDHEKFPRCSVVILPSALAAECPCPTHFPSLRKERIVAPAVPVPAAPCLRAAGLRAPPVSA